LLGVGILRLIVLLDAISTMSDLTELVVFAVVVVVVVVVDVDDEDDAADAAAVIAASISSGFSFGLRNKRRPFESTHFRSSSARQRKIRKVKLVTIQHTFNRSKSMNQ
jgi:hypothetical protein